MSEHDDQQPVLDPGTDEASEESLETAETIDAGEEPETDLAAAEPDEATDEASDEATDETADETVDA